MVQGGVGTLSYAWNPSGQGTQTATNLLPNTYTVTVTDADGCQTTATGTVGNIPPGTASINATTDVSCFGGNDGTATGTIVGGTAPYTYEWYTSTGALIGQQTQTATGLSAGDYYVIVTDANTCQSQSNTITIGQPNDLTIAVAVNDANCFGTCTGSAEATPAGGTGPYSYQWDNALNEITAIAQGLCAQTYNVIVTDNNGCTETAQAIVNEPTPIELDSTVVNANCNQADGSACVLASGGTAPYTYLWPNGATNSCEVGLAAGTYVVLVTDDNDCQATIAVEVSDNGGPSAAIVAQTDALCFGSNDGSATVDMVGGNGNNYTVLWDAAAGGQTSPTASNLSAGTYGVTITDDLGCSASTNVTIGEPLVLQHVLNTVDASCFSYCDGELDVNIAGGTQPYTYQWLDGTGANVGNADVVTGLCAGNYVLNLTDANGCPLTVNGTINEPVQVTASAIFTDVICNGNCDGTATATGINGVAPFTYQWDDPNTQNTATATNLCPGTYTCTVTDADGCFTTVSVTITEPTVVVASIPASGNESCSGFCDGFAQADAVGGVGGYSYTWNNGAGNTQIVNNLCANTYTVTVTDANGCTDDEFVVISTPNPLAATTNSTNVSCYNACDGTAGINVSGGTTPYAYQWDNPAFSTTANVTGLCAGTWTVVVTDANGCSITQTVIITQPNELSLTATITDANCGQSNGSIATAPVGGVGPFVYQWSNQTSTTSATLSNEPAGCYTITIVDANACVFDSLMCINDIVGPTVTGINSQDVTCNGDMDGFVEYQSVGGTAPVTFELLNSSNTSVNTGQLLTNNLSGDCYTLVATDAAGCISTDVLCINEPNALNSAVTSSTDVSCFLGNDGQATVSSSGGTLPHNYSWSTNPIQTTATATALSQGTYTVTTTDDNGCTHQSTVTITEPTQLVLTNTAQTNVSCNGGSDGSVEITATGGTMPYIYTWNPNVSTNPLASGLSAGSYTATVTDGNGCVEALGATITEPQPLALSSTTVNSTCTLCNGEATVTVTGGTAPYAYNWLNGGTATTAATNTGMCPGAHSVTVTDANGCTATIQLTIIDEPSPTINGFNMTEPLCNGLTNGSAEVLVSGGTVAGNYTFSWDANAFNQVSQTALALPAGVYCVTVSDDNGCTDFDCVTVTEPSPLVPVPDIEATICYGDSTQVWASAAGGTAPYTVNWQTAGLNGPGPISVNPLLTETYCFTITDDNGCLSDDTCGTVTVLPALELTTSGNDAICDGESINISATASGGNGGPYTINWVDEFGQAYNGTMNGNTSDLNVTPVIDTWYYAYLSDGCSLDTLDSLQIIVHPNPVSFLNVADDEGCEPFDAQFILNTDIAVSFEYDFDCDGNVDYTGPNPNPTYTYTGAGTYDVCVNTISVEGCETMVSEPGLITVHPQPVADFTMDPQTTTFLTPTITMTNLSVGATNYHWDFGDGDTISGFTGNIPAGTNNGYTVGTFENPIHTYQDTGLFTITLTITTDFGCTDQISYQVYIEGDYVIYVPNAFTPDGNGLNDVFIPQGIGISDEEYDLYIYNRWGELVFESHDKNIGWDGRDKTGNLKLDVYVWLVRTKDHKGQEHEYVGHVTLLR
jgi:gliding motility-associated-like protein